MSCEIITFYSYKGGTGRSMALANVAWILAANGKKVLVLDWDLEAPGLHRYYHPFLEDKELTSSEGIIDFVIDFAAEALNPAGPQEKDWYVPFSDILRYASSLKWDFPAPGTLDFVPAGRQGPDYPTRVNSFNWEKFYERLGGGVFLEASKRSMSGYDYVLIDSRTGVSDTSGVCTIQMPDTLVVCFTYNIQSIEGAAAVAESALSLRRRPDGEPTLQIFPVPMRVEFAEKLKLDLAKEAARERFDPLLWQMTDEERASYWERVQVNYQPFYAYEETLATFGDRPREPDTLLSRMEVLTQYLTAGDVTRLPPLPEEKRQEWRAKFARQPKPARQTARAADNQFWFYFSYAGGDANSYVERFFKDLRAEVGQRAGVLDEDSVGFFNKDMLEVGDTWPGASLSALLSSRTMVCLFSPRYFNSEYCGKEVQLFHSRMDMYRLGSLGVAEPPTILPVIMTPVGRSLPQSVSDIQYLAGVYPRVYADEGLLYMMRLRKYREEYEEFVALFAKRLVEVATQYQLPSLDLAPSLPDTPNAFADKMPRPGAMPAGPTNAEFFFIAATREQMSSLKTRPDEQHYGLENWEWEPFSSETKKQIGILTQQVATEEAFIYRAPPLELDLIKRLEAADQNNVIVILVVDPWSLQIPFFNKLMSEFDSRVFVNCGVLVLWDTKDAETSANRENLEQLVRRVFYRQLLSTSPQYFRASVQSPDEFVYETKNMLTALRLKVIERARLLRPVVGENISRPTISGPGGYK
jgi:FxsC-like protein